MRQKVQLIKMENGNTIVEASIVYPITIFVFFVLFYSALFLCQRANLQANLEDALIYYKNVGTDTYVSVNDSMVFSNEGDTVAATGNEYRVTAKLNPYRRVGKAVTNAIGFKEINSDDFSKFFHSSYGHMFFDNGNNVEVELVKVTDAILYKKITARATQTVQSPINIAIVGAKNSMVISAEATVVVVDGDDMIRDIDFAVDMVEKTKLGEAAKEVAGKAMGFYDDLKETLGIE